MMTDSSQGLAVMELGTPKRTDHPTETTPRRSERKRTLFPSSSPQTSDLGHMSPLGSSPDRFSSAPNTPDSDSFCPIKEASKSTSPFGRKVGISKALYAMSPRKRFSELFGKTLKEKSLSGNSDKIIPLSSIPSSVSRHALHKNTDRKADEIVPIDQLEQTVLSVLDDSDGPESPLAERTPRSTLQSKSVSRATSDPKSAQPLTPSKRRSLPPCSSESTASTSPQSPVKRFSLGSRSMSDHLPRARTSLFSGNGSSGKRRVQDDGIYLTGRGGKRGRMTGEINGGVRTGIRRPPKVKPKQKPKASSGKKQGKVKSIWDVAPKSNARKRMSSPVKLPKMSLLASRVKCSDEELASFSASASRQVQLKKRSRGTNESEAEESEKEEADPEPDPTKRFFKTKSRKPTYTLDQYRLGCQGKKVGKTHLPPATKRRRKLYDREKHIEAIKEFEDNHEDLADSTRGDVQNILQKLEKEKSECSDEVSPTSLLNPVDPLLVPGNTTSGSALGSDVEVMTSSAAPDSPPRLPGVPPELGNFLSPLSQLATSTSTLSINVGNDTLRLNKAQVQALTAVPDVIMEDDDDDDLLPSVEVDSNQLEQREVNDGCEAKTSMLLESSSEELKENGNCETISSTTPSKYFPIFSGQFSNKIDAVSSTTERKRKRSLLRPIGNDQYQLDAGQKRFGPTECGECGAVYQMGEPEDEIAHTEYHNAVKELKHPGWKQERVVGAYGKDRVVLIRPGDPKPWWSKALKVLQVVDNDLGFVEGVQCDPDRSMAYFYISDNQIVGFLLAIPVKKAYKMLLTAADTADIDCCSAEEYPVICGVSRIWVHKSKRRCNIASHLMDCMRKNFAFGHILSLEEIAFSTPTALGKIFAEHYVGRKDYFVFIQ